MSSRFARPQLTPNKYKWCKKGVIVQIPWVGNPWPPCFKIYVAYQLIPAISPPINAQGQGNIARLAPLAKYQGTFKHTFANLTASAEVTMMYNSVLDDWTISINAYIPGVMGPPLAAYHVKIPNLWAFRWSAPPWDLTHPSIRTSILRIRSGP